MNGARPYVLLAIWMALMFMLLTPTNYDDPPPRHMPPSPVEPQAFTTDSGVPWRALDAVQGGIPSPGPNQKRTGQCDEERSEVEINGGCWVKTEKPRPCPPGKQWEHEGRCWLPVAHAKQLPQSGGRGAGPVAE